MDYPKSVPGVNLVNGKFSDGDPINNIPASLDPASWNNAVTEEILNVIRAAEMTPAEAKHTQLRDAINSIITSAIDASGDQYKRVHQSVFNFPDISWNGTAAHNVLSHTYHRQFPQSRVITSVKLESVFDIAAHANQDAEGYVVFHITADGQGPRINMHENYTMVTSVHTDGSRSTQSIVYDYQSTSTSGNLTYYISAFPGLVQGLSIFGSERHITTKITEIEL